MKGLGRIIAWLFKAAAALSLLGVLCVGAAVLVTGSMIATQDEPAPAQAIVVLGGGWYRPLAAADLYRQGLAPLVCVPRVRHRASGAILAEVGVDIPEQQEIYRRLLLSRGVPQEAVRLYGEDIASTRAEAAAVAREFPDFQRIIVVTSPYHVLRARLIFSRALPRTEVLVTSAPGEPFPARWWTDRDAAVRVVNETAKLVWYLVGGTFSVDSAAPGSNGT
ncbi:YdcF family protein [Desulfocurvus sp. DL9XJH121]